MLVNNKIYASDNFDFDYETIKMDIPEHIAPLTEIRNNNI